MSEVRSEGASLPIRIRPVVQRYRWGRRGTKSLVANLSGSAASSEPAAELWVGAHPAGSATALLESGEMPLRTLILDQPAAMLGRQVAERFHGELPFLLKVLSIDEPLSLQLHPDREIAPQLHTEFPQRFRDPHHKPEQAVALESAALFYGFRPFAEQMRFLRAIPALAAGLQVPLSTKSITASHVIRNLGRMSEESVAPHLQAIGAYLRDTDPAVEKLFTRALTLFGDHDRGLLLMPLLRYVVLREGGGVFVEPNQMHAYLSGELLECMANSDNVVRVGLTPKEQDFTLAADLLERGASASPPAVNYPVSEQGIRHFTSYCDEFELLTLHQAERVEVGGPSLLLLIEGTAALSCGSIEFSLRAGDAYFIPASAAAVFLGAGGRAALARLPN